MSAMTLEQALSLATECQNGGRLLEAEAIYRSILQVRPDLAEVAANLGSVLQLQGRLDEALAAFRQALSLRPELAERMPALKAVAEQEGDRLDRLGLLDSALSGYVGRLDTLSGDSAAVQTSLSFGRLLHAAGHEQGQQAQQRLSRLIEQQVAEEWWRGIRDRIETTVPGCRRNNTWYLVLCGALGDAVQDCNFLKSFREHHPGGLCLIAWPKWRPLVSLYREHFDACVFMENLHDRRYRLVSRFQAGYPFNLTDDGRALEQLRPVAHVMDLHRFRFHLPLGTPMHPPRIDPEIAASARQRFEAYGLVEGRTVILAPFANTAPRVNLKWWEALARTLMAKGYRVVTNVRQTSRPADVAPPISIADTPTVDFPMEEIIPFLDLAGYFVGSLSGICELAGWSTAKLKIIYSIDPDNSKRSHFTEVDPMNDCFYFGDNGYNIKIGYNHPHCDEHLLKRDEEFDVRVVENW